MRIIRFLKRLKRKYNSWRRFATRREAIRWAWLQSKNGKADDRLDKFRKAGIKVITNIKDLEDLKEDVGDELFNKLTEEQRNFIIRTEGSIDLGKEFNQNDLDKITKDL